MKPWMVGFLMFVMFVAGTAASNLFWVSRFHLAIGIANDALKVADDWQSLSNECLQTLDRERRHTTAFHP